MLNIVIKNLIFLQMFIFFLQVKSLSQDNPWQSVSTFFQRLNTVKQELQAMQKTYTQLCVGMQNIDTLLSTQNQQRKIAIECFKKSLKAADDSNKKNIAQKTSLIAQSQLEQRDLEAQIKALQASTNADIRVLQTDIATIQAQLSGINDSMTVLSQMNQEGTEGAVAELEQIKNLYQSLAKDQKQTFNLLNNVAERIQAYGVASSKDYAMLKELLDKIIVTGTDKDCEK